MIDRPCAAHARKQDVVNSVSTTVSLCAKCRRDAVRLAVVLAPYTDGLQDGQWRQEARIRRKYRKMTNQQAG